MSSRTMVAATVTLVLVAYVPATGEISAVLRMAVLVVWGLALIGLPRGALRPDRRPLPAPVRHL